MGQLDNPATRIRDGRKTVAAAGTPEQLTSTATRVRSLVVTAETDNTGLVAVGNSTCRATATTQRGVILSAGGSVGVDIDDLSKVYVDASVNGDGVAYAYTTF